MKNKLKEFVDQFASIAELETKKFKMVACNEFHSGAIADDGSLYVWGSVSYGKLGLEDPELKA
jgi:alpha-tubulin suppressor-like RCC1 family protein